jgi:hypothetical protein
LEIGQSRRTKINTTTLPEETSKGFTARPFRSTALRCAGQSALANNSKTVIRGKLWGQRIGSLRK